MPCSEPHGVAWLVQLVRSEFVEMPELRLTEPQARRLWGLDPLTCGALLEALVDAKFLQRTKEGLYLRAGGETAHRRPGLRMARQRVNG